MVTTEFSQALGETDAGYVLDLQPGQALTSMTSGPSSSSTTRSTPRYPRPVASLHEEAASRRFSHDEAEKGAMRDTVSFLTQTLGLSPDDAYVLAGVAVDFEIPQIENQNRGIHAMIYKRLFANERLHPDVQSRRGDFGRGQPWTTELRALCTWVAVRGFMP